MADEMITKPTIETVLERISAFENRFVSRFEHFEKQVAERFDRIDNEIDRVASVAHSTRAEMLTLRADFRELRTQLREVLPVPQAS
jgi:phage regulator Rha-like protein